MQKFKPTKTILWKERFPPIECNFVVLAHQNTVSQNVQKQCSLGPPVSQYKDLGNISGWKWQMKKSHLWVKILSPTEIF